MIMTNQTTLLKKNKIKKNYKKTTLSKSRLAREKSIVDESQTTGPTKHRQSLNGLSSC